MSSVALRIGALVVAVGLVVGALLVRERLDGAGDGGPTTVGADEVVFSCSRDLTTVCTALRGALPDADVTTARVTDQLAGAAEVPALVPASWADVEDDRRRRAGEPTLERSQVLASTPVLLVAFEDQARVLADRCGVPVEQLTWSCVGDQAGASWVAIGGESSWGPVRLGHGPPDTATGLLATTAVIASRTGVPFALNDLQAFEVTTWWQAVEGAVGDHTPIQGTHLTGMVVAGRSVANVATATEAEATLLDLAPAYGRIVAIPAEPVFWHDLVVVGQDEDAVDAAAEAVGRGAGAAALAASGWRTGSAPPAGSPLTTTPGRAALPDGGVLTAVRTQFQRVAG